LSFAGRVSKLIRSSYALLHSDRMSRATAGAVDGRRLRCGLEGGAADMKVRDSPYSIGARRAVGSPCWLLVGRVQQSFAAKRCFCCFPQYLLRRQGSRVHAMAVPEVPDEGAVRGRPNPVKAEALFPVAGP
jgi:hypothetical protein